MIPAESERQAWIAVGERVAALRIELRRAEYDRKQLDYPMFVRVSDEPREERRATDEEVSAWKATADACVAEIERRIRVLLSGVER